MKIRILLLCVMMCGVLVGCGKKLTEYESAKQNEITLSKNEQQYLEKYWYGSWQKYYSMTGEFDEKEHVIDETLYDGARPYIIKNISIENENSYIEYELYDLDTGQSEGLWEDTITVDDNVETIYTEWKDERFGGQSAGILVRKIKE